jgi:hypothetical protein
MNKHSDLDILLRWDETSAGFDLVVLFNAPGDVEDYQYFSDHPVHLDLDRLASLQDDTTAYGVALGQALFGGSATSYLDRALRLAEDMPVNLRLIVNDETPQRFATIRWETLRHPVSRLRLSTSENIRFSRYLSNPDGTPPSPLELRDRLAALVVVANPAGIEGYDDGLSRLTPIDVADEVARARAALNGMSVEVLNETGTPATTANIVDALQKGDVNLLYLVCHGMVDEDGPKLFLENDRGNVDKVDGTSLAERIGDLPRAPTLAALVSCQSAGRDSLTSLSESALAVTAFGPALSRAGCAVVLAMQGNITMDTASRFMRRFFTELRQDGVPARAMAAARSDISDEPDWYVPVLYSRLKRGSAWYLPKFGKKTATLFRNLRIRIGEGNCTPMIGSGVAAEDDILCSREELAKEWADIRHVPLVDPARLDLASVAQYLQVDNEDRAVPRDELRQLLRRCMKKRHGAALPDLDWTAGHPNELIREVGKHIRKTSGGTDNYSRLAALKLPVFVTTAWNGLLEDALREAGKEPVDRHFEWYRPLPAPAAWADISVQTPLVYHLFGTLEVPQSLVLAEDDYFAWLRAWMKQVDKGAGIPDYVKPPLMDSSLTFLGYRFDDWEFRMIFQAIKGFEGTIGEYGRHVGVQFEPTGLRVEPEAAQEYLEDYLGAERVDVYWGNCGRFLEDLGDE